MIRTTVSKILNSNTQRGHPLPRGSVLVSLTGAFALGTFAVTGAIADDAMHDAREGTAAYQQEGQRQAQTQAAKVHASPAQVSMIQERLADEGHDPGTTDGQWTASTKQAVKNFQQANDLAATGRLDTSLISALDAEGVLAGRTEQGFFQWLGGFFGDEDDAQIAQGEATPIYVSPEHVAHIQQALRDQGFDPGEIDGQWGPSTVQAANEFRQQQGLERSEVLDVALLSSLGTDRVLGGDRILTGDTVTGGVAAGTERTEAQRTASLADAQATPLYADPQTVRTVQRRLQEEGHDPGMIDGRWGESTQAAIRSYQQERDELSVTGELTLPTLAALDVDVQDPDHIRDEGTVGDRG